MNGVWLSGVSRRRGALGLAALAALLGLSGCATVAPRSAAVAYRLRRPDTTVYAYPMRHQSRREQSRDRYECAVWAVHQSGFDPSAPGVPVYDRVTVQGPPPGTDTALGAVAGAVLGAAISNPWDRGSGAVFGALTGAMIGSMGDAANAQAKQQARQDASDQAYQAQRELDHKARDYRRALTACLEARGYAVK